MSPLLCPMTLNISTSLNADILVYSSADTDHPEILKAWQNGISVARRAEVLSLIFNARRGVGVAGTHGKSYPYRQ